jgi:hypothetical protein
MIHGLLVGGALAIAAGVGPAAAQTLSLPTTRPPSDFSTLQVPTPYGTQAFNPDGYELRVSEYEATQGIVPAPSRRLRSGRAAVAAPPPVE